MFHSSFCFFCNSLITSLFLSSVFYFQLCVCLCVPYCQAGVVTSLRVSCLVLKSLVFPCSMCFVLLSLWRRVHLCQLCLPGCFHYPLVYLSPRVVCLFQVRSQKLPLFIPSSLPPQVHAHVRFRFLHVHVSHVPVHCHVLIIIVIPSLGFSFSSRPLFASLCFCLHVFQPNKRLAFYQA